MAPDLSTILTGMGVAVLTAGVIGIFKMSHSLAKLTASFDAHLVHEHAELDRIRSDMRRAEERLHEQILRASGTT